ncbi:cyclase family protein [Pseudalkalibacillus sp. SCS-8]|uniref:cyclase family protein n=1 Tax=Pseudalkalibacillus nanhaiensis TaxID=3115291 RepID=UPI0032D9FA8C
MPKKRYIDLSHTIENGLITYKGLPAPVICDYLSHEASREQYEEGTEFQIGKIEMVSNTSTYVDVPFHRYKDGKDLNDVMIERFAGLDGVLISIDKGTKEIDEHHFHGADVEGKAVLVHTDWDRHWNTEQYFEGHPYLTEKAAQYLRDKNVALVGIDSMNIDNTSGNNRPVHSTLLGSEILIVEHLCHLNELVDQKFRFYAVPPKIKGMGTFAVRAFAEIME